MLKSLNCFSSFIRSLVVPAHNNLFWHLFFSFQSRYSSNFYIFGSLPKNRRRRYEFKRYVNLIYYCSFATPFCRIHVDPHHARNFAFACILFFSEKKSKQFQSSSVKVKLHNRDLTKGKKRSEWNYSPFSFQDITRILHNLKYCAAFSAIFASLPKKNNFLCYKFLVSRFFFCLLNFFQCLRNRFFYFFFSRWSSNIEEVGNWKFSHRWNCFHVKIGLGLRSLIASVSMDNQQLPLCNHKSI